MTESPAPIAPGAARKRRGLLGFFFKSALGCSAFAFGSLVVLVLLLPRLVSGPVGSFAANAFGERFHGRLEVGQVDLGWFSPQSIENAVLRDPKGKEIARVSVQGPSLIDALGARSGRIGRITIEVDADLVADDEGITNLQRALEPRARSSKEDGSSSTSSDSTDGESLDDLLARLDVELEVRSKRISWSDAETRRTGKPFELRDLNLTVVLASGAPIRVQAGARIATDGVGDLEVDAKIAGPFQVHNAFTFGKIDASAKIVGFSTAMVDGLANLNGDLRAMLGPKFDVIVNAEGVTPKQGDVRFELTSERARITLLGRLDNGVLRSTNAAFLEASVPAPSGFFEHFVRPLLPPGTTVALEPTAQPWTVRIGKCALKLPEPGANTLATLAPTLESAEFQLDVEMPGRILCFNSASQAAGVVVGVDAPRIQARLAPGQAATLRFEAALDTGAPGRITVDVTAREPWKALAQGQSPTVDIDALVRGLSNIALSALVGQPGVLPRALGPTTDVTLAARGASATSGKFDVRVASSALTLQARAALEQGIVRIVGEDKIAMAWTPSADFVAQDLAPRLPLGFELALGAGPLAIDVHDVEFALPKPEGTDVVESLAKSLVGAVTVTLPELVASDATLRAKSLKLALSSFRVESTLARGGALTAKVRGGVDVGEKGTLALDLACPDAWAIVRASDLAKLPPVDLQLVLEGIPTSTIDALGGTGTLLSRALGKSVALKVDARGASLNSGTIHAEGGAPNATFVLDASFDGAGITATGDKGLHVSVHVPSSFVDEQLAAFVPANSKVTWPKNTADVEVSVREIRAALPDTSKGPFELGTFLDSLAAALSVRVAGVGFENELTRTTKTPLVLRNVEIASTLAPGKRAAVTIASDLFDSGAGKLAVEASTAAKLSSLMAAGAPVPAVDAIVTCTDLDLSTIDALLAQDGLVKSALGPTATIRVTAQDVSPDKGRVELALTSARAEVQAKLVLANGVLTTPDGQEISATIQASKEVVSQLVTPHLPAGTRLELATDAGPLTARIRGLRFVLPKAEDAEPKDVASSGAATEQAASTTSSSGSASPLALVASTSFTLDAVLPALVYADAETDAAGKPVAIRDMVVNAKLSPGENPLVHVGATIVDEPPGSLVIDLDALDPLAKLGEEKGLDTYRVKAKVSAKNVPTALLDVLARQDGMLREALGPRCEVSIDAPDASMERGAFTMDFKSDIHNVHAEGKLENSVILVDKVDGVLGRVGLGPLTSERVVGRLLPLMVNLEKPSGSAPAAFAVDNLRFGLDGDLSKLDAVVRLDLGEVGYKLLPGLEGLLGNLGTQNTTLPAITVPIAKGVARYDRLPIKIGGKEYVFKGSYNLVDGVMSLGADVPLSLLGKKLNDKLDKVRDLIPPYTLVPIEVRGTWNKPKFGVGKQFLDTVVEKALSKGLEGLLDGLGKKKKKN